MSLLLNTGAMQYRADGSSGWQPLTLVANVDLTSLADAFSESATYEVGEYVRRDSRVYRCITAITTAGPWDSTKWLEVNLADEINRVYGELKTSVTKLPESRLVGKQVAIYADSWGASYHGSFGADYISNYTGVPVHLAADAGGTLSRIYTNAWDSFNADVYVISGGLNDVGADTTIANFVTAINTWCTAIRNVNANAEIYFVTPPMMRTAAVHTNLYPLELYRIAIWRMAAIKKYNVINSLKWVDITLESDQTHPIVADAPKIGKHVVAAISNYGDEETHIHDYCNINGLLVVNNNNQLEYICDGGNFYLRTQYFDQAYTSGTQVTINLPTGSGADLRAFSYTIMAGDVSPAFIQHSTGADTIVFYRKAASGVTTIYSHGALVPITLSSTLFTT